MQKRRREGIINPPPPKTVLAFQVNKHLFAVKQPTVKDEQVAKTNNELTENKIRTIPKTNIVSPIIVGEKAKWTSVSKIIIEKGREYTKAGNVKSGIKITPNTGDDYKKLNEM